MLKERKKVKSYDAIFWGMISKIKSTRHTSELH